MGVGDALKSVRIPTTKDIIGGYKESKNSVSRINVNLINVRFYPTNSPFFYPTKGELYHFTQVTVLKIEVPEKLGFIVQDNSIFFDKSTKEEWVDCRQDYPLTLAVNDQLADIIKNAIKTFPDTTEWYIPASINKIPVKNVIIHRDTLALKEQKEDLLKQNVSKNIVEWMDNIPADITVTPRFLYDFMDVQVIGSLKNEENKFNWAVFIMGGLSFSLLTVMFMLYIGW